MKAIILAAGMGTRMLPLTDDKPKVMVEVNGKPFLHYVFETLRQAGVDSYGIVVGYKYRKILEFLAAKDIHASVIFQTEQKGAGDAVIQSEFYTRGSEFIVINGDSLFHPDDIKRFIDAGPGSYVACYYTETPEKYGVLDMKGSRLVRVIEKPKKAPSNCVNAGIYRFAPEIFTALSQITPSKRGELELVDAINILAGESEVNVLQLQHFWQDFGCPEDVPLMEKRVKSIQL